jgi:hypothetical protein
VTKFELIELKVVVGFWLVEVGGFPFWKVKKKESPVEVEQVVVPGVS